MSQWEKLLQKLYELSPDLRFEELKKILESYGYDMRETKAGSSHCTFRKKGCAPITIPRHRPIKTVYLKLVKAAVEGVHEEER